MQWIVMASGLGLMLFVRIRRVKRVWRHVATWGGSALLMIGILFQPIVWGVRDVDLVVDRATIRVQEEAPVRAEIEVIGHTTQRFRIPAGYRIVLYIRSGIDRFTRLDPAIDVAPQWSWRGEVELDPAYDSSEIHVALARLLSEADVGVNESAYRVESALVLLEPLD